MRLVVLAVVALSWPSFAISEVPSEESPFRLGNLIYREAYTASHPARERYGDVPFQYPSAKTCLTQDQEDEQTVDDADMNWKALSSVEAVEVCLFRVASKLQTKERIIQWMIGQGWESKLQNEVSDLNHIYDVSGTTWQLTFFWNTELQGPPFGTEPQKLSYLTTELSATASLMLNNESGLLRVIYRSRTNWNK